jgi:DNA-binding NtrC family response regulator
MKARVLVVDDDPDVREVLGILLEGEGYEVSSVGNAAELRAAWTRPAPDLVLLDWQLPDGDGIELLPLAKKHWPETEVIMLTGHGTLEAAVEATKRGAFHFQSKPFESKSLLLLVQRACERKQLAEQTTFLRRAVSTLSGGASPVFKSSAMRAIVRTVERVAPSEVSILITGESGTGKEVIADLIHALSPRAKGPLIKINCAALPRELIESELFGAVKGAYTGANADREGLFRQAEGGTLLLDELSEMPVDTQTKLLRVLQEREFRPVGGRTSYRADCRILAATNRRVEDALRDHKLREDLYYRISAITVALPPLRDRREDILPMASAFLQRFAAQAGRSLTGFTPTAIARLRSFHWPGNVRQLQNEVQRAVLMCEGTVVDDGDLSVTATDPASPGGSNVSLLEGVERNTILQMLRQTGGNKLEAARRLGIGRQTLYNKIRQYGLQASTAHASSSASSRSTGKPTTFE